MSAYDGTVTSQDPNLVETFDLDEQTRAYVVRDTDATLPLWDTIGDTYRVSYDHDRYDEHMTGNGPDVDVIRAAWDRFADSELVARYLRAFHDAAGVDYSESVFRDSRVWALVTNATATEWGSEDPSGLASGGLEVIRQWADGEVYGVIVVNLVTGDEDSLWDVYDSSPDLTYCRQVADDLAPIGVQLEESTCRHCGRRILGGAGSWFDPEATGDDAIWRETCEDNDTFTAEHEPTES